MIESTQPPARSPRSLLLGLCLIIGVSITLFVLADQHQPPGASTTETALPDYTRTAPPLPDHAPIIGVEHNGIARAYPLAQLMKPSEHVQNEVFGGDAVSITYSDLDGCVRVFHEPKRTEKLRILAGVDGRRDRKMVLEVGGIRYWQDTGAPVEANTLGAFPYRTLPHKETTWGEWRRLYPHSERYIGNGRFAPAVR